MLKIENLHRIDRGLRVIAPGERPPRPIDYWRSRDASERLRAVLALHREGNVLFKGGNPPFSFQSRFRDGIRVAVIGLDDLRSNNRATGRLQDLADLEQLEYAGQPPARE